MVERSKERGLKKTVLLRRFTNVRMGSWGTKKSSLSGKMPERDIKHDALSHGVQLPRSGPKHEPFQSTSRHRGKRLRGRVGERGSLNRKLLRPMVNRGRTNAYLREEKCWDSQAAKKKQKLHNHRHSKAPSRPRNEPMEERTPIWGQGERERDLKTQCFRSNGPGREESPMKGRYGFIPVQQPLSSSQRARESFLLPKEVARTSGKGS